MFINDRMNKYTVAYYYDGTLHKRIKTIELQLYTATQINFMHVVWSKVSQIQNVHTISFHLYKF